MPAILLLIVVWTVANVEGNPTGCSNKIDLLFIIDGSLSICGDESCPDWGHNLEFIKNIVTNFNIGPNDTRVALVTVSSQAKLEWNFEKYTDEDSLLSAIDNFPYPGGEMESIFPVISMLTSLIKAATSQRSDATIVAIGIGDGALILQNAAVIAASNTLQAIGMNVCAICVTDKCPVDVAKSASSPPRQINETYFVVKDYSSLDSTRENLLKQICSFKGTSLVGSIIGGISNVFG